MQPKPTILASSVGENGGISLRMRICSHSGARGETEGSRTRIRPPLEATAIWGVFALHQLQFIPDARNSCFVEGNNHTGTATAIDDLESLDCIVAARLEVGSDLGSSRGLD